VKLARESASLDHLSGGRLIVGIGAMSYEYDYLGEEPDARVRGAMLDVGGQASSSGRALEVSPTEVSSTEISAAPVAAVVSGIEG
jgi:hypothetical protein